MSGVGGSTGGGGGSGSGGAGNDVAQELGEVRAKIEKLEKAIDVQQQKIDVEQDKDERRLMRESLAADKQWLVELQKEKNRLADQQQREQQPQAGEWSPSVWCFVRAPMYSVRSRRRLLCVAGGAVICVVRSDVWRRRWRHERVEMT